MTSRDLQANLALKKKNHPECGNPDPKRYIWYIFAYMWVLPIK